MSAVGISLRHFRQSLQRWRARERLVATRSRVRASLFLFWLPVLAMLFLTAVVLLMVRVGIWVPE